MYASKMPLIFCGEGEVVRVVTRLGQMVSDPNALTARSKVPTTTATVRPSNASSPRRLRAGQGRNRRSC